jgi:hypothetical protein
MNLIILALNTSITLLNTVVCFENSKNFLREQCIMEESKRKILFPSIIIYLIVLFAYYSFVSFFSNKI